jgi:hypothetical protein
MSANIEPPTHPHLKIYWEFWRKYALGDLTVPSCFGCGQLTQEPKTTHLELHGIVLCARCTDAIQRDASQASGFSNDTSVKHAP